MTEYYLSDDIFIYNGKYYKNNKVINDKIWHKELSIIGWVKLERRWVLRFNNFIKNKTLSKWGIFDADNNGNCFFSCVAEAINNNNKLLDSINILDSMHIRNEISKEINENNFNDIMNIYKIETLCNEFKHSWNIDDIKNYNDLRNELTKSGHNYWADHIIIQLFQKRFNLNLIILNKSYNKKQTKLYPLLTELKRDNDTIILYYINQFHFKLIGYFIDNKMKTIFNYNELPIEILKVYEIDCSKNI